MGDRTPDTDVLDQDDPSAKPCGAEDDSVAESAEKDSGEASGEATAAAEPAEESGEPAAQEPQSPEAEEKPEAAPEPAQPKDAADTAAQEPAEPDDAPADEPADEAMEPAGEPEKPKQSQEEPETPEQSQEKAETPETEPESPETAEEPQTPKATQEPAQPQNAPDTTAPEPAEPDDAPADEPADEGDERGEAPAQDAEPLLDEAPDAEEDATASGDHTEAPAEAEDTAPDEDTDAAAEAGSSAPDPNTAPTTESDDPAPTPNLDATAKADPKDDSKDDPDDAPEQPAAPQESDEDPTAPQGSESTRTLALRSPEAAPAEADRTMAISVADLPDAESPQAPPAPSPIDLLAQLTNTPPPPATPLRTTFRRVKIWSPLVALVALVLLVVQLLRPLPDPALALDASTSSFTIGGDAFTMPWPEEGQAAVKVVGSGSIGTFGEQKPVPTASVAKIMTAYVLLHERPLKKDEPGPSVTVDARAVAEGKSKHESRIEGLKVGQTFTLQDMLKMLMIPSGNNVARLLARWDTQSEDETAFVRKMNAAAKSLGMTNTTYTDPSGLDKGTVSTAVDQLKLAEAVMRFESFRAVVAMPNADIPGVGRIYNNNDRLIVAGLSVRGIKTGSNTAAGGTLSWAAYRTVDGEDRLILGSMMDQHAPPPDLNGGDSLLLVQDRSEKVIRAVREALTSATAVQKGQVVGYVDDGLGGRTPVVATKDLKVVGVPGQKLKLTFRDGGEDLGSGTKAGTVVGALTVDGAAGAQSVPVALKSDLQEPSVGAKLTRLG